MKLIKNKKNNTFNRIENEYDKIYFDTWYLNSDLIVYKITERKNGQLMIVFPSKSKKERFYDMLFDTIGIGRSWADEFDKVQQYPTYDEIVHTDSLELIVLYDTINQYNLENNLTPKAVMKNKELKK